MTATSVTIAAACTMFALTGCASAVNEVINEKADQRYQLHCENLPEVERASCRERIASEYRDYEAQRAAITGSQAKPSESFEEFQQRRAEVKK